jgi:hypothetical protein
MGQTGFFDLQNRLCLRLFSVIGEQVYAASIEGKTGINDLNWNLRNGLGSRVASGLYLYFVKIDDQSEWMSLKGKILVLH